MVPLWPLPSLLGLTLVAAWILGKFSPGTEKVLNRISRVLFSRFVSESQTRKRRLEAAYATETYRTYATKTLLFVLMASVAGSILGTYAVASFLAVLEPLVWALAGLPDTITRPIGITTEFTLVLSSDARWLVLIIGGLALGVLSATLSYVFRWQLPASTASVRAQGIEEGMPRTAAFIYALSRGGLEFPQVLRILAHNRAVYGETANEMNVAVREMDLFGRDMISALRRMARRTPSEQFKTFAENMTSVLQSGSDLPTFFRGQYERFREEQAEQQETVLELLATIAEMYVTVLVAGTLFLITILLVFGLLVADTLMLLMLMIYLMIPLGNAAFALILQQKLDELGIARESGVGALDHLKTSTPTNVQPSTKTTRPDGGVVGSQERENQRMLNLYDRVSRIKKWLRNPLRTFLWEPTKLLWITVPIAAVIMLVRMPSAFQAEGVTTRILDDVVIQSMLFVLITYAMVREHYKRRLNRIEDAMPELLERLASLNEAGMSVVEGFDRLRGSDLGVLSPEVERIWRDLEYGSNVGDALVRLGRRVRTTAVTRIVTLLTNALRASGDMGPVLRVAAEQARAEVKLRRQRSQQMMTYLVVIYVSFFVFLLIVAAINQVLIPSLPDVVPTPSDSVNRLPGGSTGFDQLGSVDKAAYSLVFFHGAMIQAALAGFIAGQLGEGSLRDGAKHAALMVTIAYVFMLLLSAPVASISATGVTADQNNVYGIEEVSLSEGGYIAVYDEDGVNGELLAKTEYLKPGKHSEIVIPVDRELGDGQSVRIVAHQETNDNNRFDYTGPPSAGQQSVDVPYKSIGDSDQPGVEVQIQRIDLPEES